ncbi:uncharacterized protein LOC123402578 isoform X1 [Hordeum vulgare subsp. vulgare]|uniref:uncharacterized protein LOC123402578 isoform X1 n=1 Tax=Hordeum vulgare subsp. vulgare TaxID=112509 RepID=UPI000B475345|nr:uncharacterized protein LOC123402578 isoform X1 [Hordeum vulgare subsp. vulgare]
MPGWTRSSLLRGSSAWAPASAAAPSSAGPSYEILCEFFNCFESSTRLLRMKGSKATFPNICASIRNLAERRFTYGHLAQLKYIMPEAMVQRVHASIVVNSLGTYYIGRLKLYLSDSTRNSCFRDFGMFNHSSCDGLWWEFACFLVAFGAGSIRPATNLFARTYQSYYHVTTQPTIH